jgi:2-polyprenyl-3-methyl-5-hydroxy-6-metoxy-1,4-benzoquinol methylase
VTNQSFDPQAQAEFDRYAGSYRDMHASSVAVSGEAPEYFAIYKQKVLERMLGARFDRPVLDFGCGIGNLTLHLAKSFETVHGYDPSAESVKLAATRAPKATFFHETEALPKDHYGAAVIANVLHHVPVADRLSLLRGVADTLAPGGRLIIFEHNPWNPVTRHAVRSCAFDDNAILLSPREVRRLLKATGLTDVELDYIVFFPRALAFARGLEASLRRVPLGAQVFAWGVKR